MYITSDKHCLSIQNIQSGPGWHGKVPDGLNVGLSLANAKGAKCESLAITCRAFGALPIHTGPLTIGERARDTVENQSAG